MYPIKHSSDTPRLLGLQLPDFLAIQMRNPGNSNHYISGNPTLGETALTKQSIFAHLSGI